MARKRPKTAASPRVRPAAAAPAESTASTQKPVVLGVLAALALLTVATYAPVWQFGFVALDDPQYVYNNPHIAGGLTPQSIAWALSAGREANWHPLTWWSHALDISLFGLNAGWHHVTNLLLHIANTLLLFGVLRRMTGSIGRSAFVAAVFAVHPLHVESVAWVAERKDVLSALFFMLALGAYVRYADAPTRARYGLVALLLAIGLMAKGMLVTFPMVVLLLDYWPLRRVAGLSLPHGSRPQRPLMSLVVEKLPLLAIVAIASTVTFLVQREGGAVKDFASFPLTNRVQNTVVSYVDYMGQFVWPVNMGQFYPFPASLPAGQVAMAALVLLAVTAGAIVVWKRGPALTVGWFWFVGMLVPVSGLVQIGGHARADRYMYLPMIGLTIAIAWSVVALARTGVIRRAIAAAGVVIVLILAFVGNRQVQFWRDTETLWHHTAVATEGLQNFGVYFGLAEWLRTTKRAAESIPEYEASIARNPSYPDARLGLVRAFIDTNQPARATAALKELIALNGSSVETRMSLGVLLMEQGRAAEAIEHFEAAARLQPDFVDAHWRLALAQAQTGHLPAALPHFAEAVRLSPDAAPIRNDYGWALVQSGQTRSALEQLQTAVRLKPDFVDAQHNLGRVLASDNQIAEALPHLAEAVRLEPGFREARLSFALALIRAKRTDDAANQLRELLRQDPQNEAARRALAAIGR